MTFLVSGGAGYIGSHTCIELIEAGYDVLIADDFSNSSPEAVRRVEKIVHREIPVVEVDLSKPEACKKLFDDHPEIDSVIHFAAFKAVGESVSKPLEYYTNNLVSTLNLLNCMREYGVKTFVFSSSATVYGDPHTVPIKEDFPLSATNPYGYTKLMIEQILLDIAKADKTWNIARLRYFNPVGAHKSGLIGEDPNGIPNNLVPYITQVAAGKLDALKIFGNDYPTPDGTGVRDYIHVVDLAKGHVEALHYMENHPGLLTINLGTGHGYSVLDMVKAFSEVVGRDIPYVIAPRRPGDIATCYADPTLAKELMGWKAEYELLEMCEDSWRWQSNNPNGYTA